MSPLPQASVVRDSCNLFPACLHQCSARSHQTFPPDQQDYKGQGRSAKVSSLTTHNCFCICIFIFPVCFYFVFCISWICIFISPSSCRQLQFMLVRRHPSSAPNAALAHLSFYFFVSICML